MNQAQLKSHSPVSQLLQTKGDKQVPRACEYMVSENSNSYADVDHDMETIKRIYERKSRRKLLVDPYYVRLQPLYGLQRLRFELKHYNDAFPLLPLRKLIVYWFEFFPILAKALTESFLFDFFMTILITLHMILFIYIHTENKDQFLFLQRLILYTYFAELALRILAKGFILPKQAFFRDPLCLFDIMLVVLYDLYLEDLIEIDFSPLRLVTLLLYLGDLIKSLGVMLGALKQSARFLLGALVIVGINSIFFAVIGVGLFHKLFHFRCLPTEENNDEQDNVWIQCNQNNCPPGYTCQYNDDPIVVPTEFDDFIYSFGQVLRLTTKDDWTVLMLYTVRIFHPWMWLYSFIIMFIGGFFGFNMVIAVLKVHFAEAAEEARVQKEEAALAKKKRDNQAVVLRDFKRIIDVAYLKEIGFYPILAKYRAALRQPIDLDEKQFFLQDHLKRRHADAPRLLSAQQNYKEQEHSSFWLSRKLQIFRVKTILLPKLDHLKRLQQKINIREVTEDEEVQEWLKEINRWQISQLSPALNVRMRQDFTSKGDVLEKYEDHIKVKLARHDKQFRKYRKMKLKVIYPELKLREPERKNRSRYPIAGTLRLQNQSLKVSITHSQNNEHIKHTEFEKDSVKPNPMKLDQSNGKTSPMQDTELMKDFDRMACVNGPKEHIKSITVKKKQDDAGQQVSKPTTENEEQVEKLWFIQGFYYNFEDLLKKFHDKPKKPETSELSLEVKYRKLRKHEARQRVMTKKLWSGNDVYDDELDKGKIQYFKDIIQQLRETNPLIWVTGLSNLLFKLRQVMMNFFTGRFSQLFFDLVIFTNFTFLALQGILNNDLILQMEHITVSILAVEMFARLFSFPLKSFLQQKALIVETVIVTLNLIEFIFNDLLSELIDEMGFRLIRGTKCLLFYRCLKYNRMASIIGSIAAETYTSYLSLVFLLFWVILIYALIGMGLYAGKFDQNDFEGMLHSFDSIVKAWMVIFNIMTNDWYATFRLGCKVDMELAMIFNFTQVIIINCFTFGLVLAILLDGFGKYLDKELAATEDDDLLQIQNQTEVDEFHTIRLKHRSMQTIKEDLTMSPNSPIQQPKKRVNLIISLAKSIREIQNKILRAHPKLYHGIKCDQALFIFNKSNPIRVVCCYIVTSKIYKITSILVIFLSIVGFSLQTYNDYELEKQFYPLDIIFACNVYIGLHLLLGVIAQGAFYDKGCYFTYIWQFTDLIYIICYFVQYKHVMENQALDFFLYFGYFRTLKVLYFIPWLENTRIALTRAMVDILKVLVTLISVWIIFAVYGIILFQNQFGFCDTPMSFDVNQTDCAQQERTWINYRHNFDNITIALPTLYVISTFDYWGEIMAIAESSQLPQYGPQAFNSMYLADVFFILFQFVGSMFFISLVTGILYSNFKSNQKALDANILTSYQLEFQQITQQIIKEFPIYSAPPDNYVRRMASKLINSYAVKATMYILLLADCINLTLFHTAMEDDYFERVSLIHHALTLVFDLWVLLNFLGLGGNRYFDNYWRRYQFLVASLATLDLILDFQTGWVRSWMNSTPANSNYQFLRLFYMFRSLRVVLLFQGLEKIQRLLRVMTYALPFLAKIFIILFTVVYTYALFGSQLYGHIQTGLIIDDQINFTNVAQAMLALFKCASGDTWRFVMTDTMHHNPLCKEDESYCGSQFNQLFFISYFILIGNVLLNLFITGLVEQFESFFQAQNSLIQTYIENIDNVKTVWCKYTSETKGECMHYKYLCKFLLDIGQPLGGAPGDNLWDVAKIASGFKLKCDHFGYIQYNQLIYELFRKCFQQAVFKEGSEESIKAIKQYNKEMQLRLMYYKRNNLQKRVPISPAVNLKANFNILHEYLNVLILFTAWEAYSKKLISNAQQQKGKVCDDDELSMEEENKDLQSNEYKQPHSYPRPGQPPGSTQAKKKRQHQMSDVGSPPNEDPAAYHELPRIENNSNNETVILKQ